MKKKISKKEQEYINRLILISKNIGLTAELKRLLDKLAPQCLNEKLKAFITILNGHLDNHKEGEKCPYCEEEIGAKK